MILKHISNDMLDKRVLIAVMYSLTGLSTKMEMTDLFAG